MSFIFFNVFIIILYLHRQRQHYDWTGARFGPVTSKDANADNINRLCSMFIYGILFVLGLIWGRLYNTSISFCVYCPVKNNITLKLNKSEEIFMVSFNF